MTEQPLDLRRMAGAIWRQRIRFLACAVIGLLLGTALAIASPPPYTARALVLLPASGLDSTGAPTRDVQTQVRIASSSDVLGRASRALHPSPGIAELRHRVHVSAPTPDLLQFAVHAPSKQVAETTANQVAASYVQWSQQGTSALVSRVVTTLKARATTLTAQATNLQSQIDAGLAALGQLDPTSAAAASEQAHLDSLRSQQSDLTSQLLNLNSQISDVQSNSAVTNSGTSVLQRASGASSALALTLTRDLGLGLLLGLIAGAVVALAYERRDRRLRRRDDIARAAGVPTIASVSTTSARSPEERLELMSRYEPTLDASFGLRWILRHLLTAHDDGPARVLVLQLPGDDAAQAVPLQLAAFSARAGVRTVLVDPIARPAIDLTTGGADHDDDDPSIPALPNLWLVDPRADAREIERCDPQLVIGVLVANGSPIERGNPDRLTTTLLAVSSGFATSETLGAVSMAASESGRSLLGVIVANPEPRDDSSGRDAAELEEPRPILPFPINPTHRAGSR
ncbi:MAG TPA: Wzz/FepE/Etk N-terminal domain-containing protein [Acidimicrobiia bacterium]|nr:Wzz/FepE/Etk N-terminal domain-containing protein [Acidimicrobiia bacterium]